MLGGRLVLVMGCRLVMGCTLVMCCKLVMRYRLVRECQVKGGKLPVDGEFVGW